MSDPLTKTFALLASTANPNAVEVLVPVLDAESSTLRTQAIEALLLRGSTRGHMEIIRRWPDFDAGALAMVERSAPQMITALRQCLGHGDAQLLEHCLEFIRSTGLYEMAPALIELAGSPRDELALPAADALDFLVDRLYWECRAKGESKERSSRDPLKLRHQMLLAFDQAVSDFKTLRQPRPIVEGILSLGDPDNFAVKKVLTQGPPACRELAGELLRQSRRPGVMQLVFDHMSGKYPLPAAFETLQRRSDPEFIEHLLRWFPHKLADLQQKNFRQLESIAWIRPGALMLDAIPADLQGALVSFVSATGLPADLKLQVQEWLVRYGSPEGRLAATAVLACLDEQSVQNILMDGLESQDAGVQAWATSQLRSQNVPQALTLLMQRLDSPLAEVREAAREELKSFDLELLISIHDRLDPAMCRRAGEMLQKVDPRWKEKLDQELRHAVRRRRLQAAQATVALGLQEHFVPHLLALLKEDDAVVRRTVAGLLASVQCPEAAEALQQLLNDPSPRVREMAAQSLQSQHDSVRPATAQTF